jgi:C4-dicarboxylate-specific signal transduction histidine kinase
MSDSTKGTGDDEMLAFAGVLAGGVARELSRPIRELRELLAIIVDDLDHHVASAKGPTPYSWRQVGRLRDRVADAYLVCRKAARLAGDLAFASSGPPVLGAVDVNKTIEAALNLARHRVSSDTELFMDFGALPSVRSNGARLMLAVARLIVSAADATEGAAGTISLTSRREDDSAVIYIVHDASTDADQLAGAAEASNRIGKPIGATVEVIERDGGAGWALRMPLGH